ncbi:MAG: beta-galactosidase [Clostridiales bacterium]|nr:beta-galactosidase [Clostridiales bacterium]
MSVFEIRDQFYLDGQPYHVISGAIHYFRIVPEYWRDRLEKLKAMGCNTVETYVAWNVHEPKKGEFCFEGRMDLRKFILLAQELGLYVIVRPSPYICAEWEFGGLPGWLLKEDGMRIRANYEPFLKHIREYYNKLFEILRPLQINYGGPIIMMQIENEYGYYGDDTNYMETMKQIMLDAGVVVPMITSDGPTDEALLAGSIPGILPTGNFGSRTEERFKVIQKYTDGGPLMCAEFWVGWFDHWGNGGHKTGNLEQSVKDLDKMLEMGHVNIYMFIGGTNFGFMNGSNYYDELTPDVTSYDYDAVLTEAGDITEKYRRYKEVISKYREIPEVEFTTNIIKKSYGKLEVQDKVSLFSVLDDISTPVSDTFTLPMEKLDQYYGYILYRSTLTKEQGVSSIKLWGANDRANIFVDQKPVVTLYDRELLNEHKFEELITTTPDSKIDILMENMGRVNFGPRMEYQRKGIEGCVQINGHKHYHWEHYTLPLDNIDKVDFTKGYKEGEPAFYRFTFQADEIGDTFLDFEGWGKGCAFINGFNLGRFWEIGPQKRLYIPGPLIKQGINEIILFETEGKSPGFITLKDEPDIG